MGHKIPQGAFRSVHAESRHLHESLRFLEDMWNEGREEEKMTEFIR